MKTLKFINILKSAFVATVVLTTACQPDEYELGQVLSKSELKYEVVQDSDDPNAVIIKALNPGTQPYWITPMGRSTKLQDTVRIPFAGDYTFVYGVITRGGVVQADPLVVTITTNNLNYVSDPLWTLLTGGVGNEKVWYLDLNADGESRYFAGPLYFYGTDDSWATVTEGQTVEGDVWNWQPDWKGNSWLMAAGDYGSMTFSLKGNAVITVDHKMLGRQESGTFFLDAAAKKLTITDASPLHDSNRDGHVVNWGDIKLMSLTENTMQLAVLRDKALSGEDPCLLVYNFISKDYYDNWVPGDMPDPEPVLPAGWKDDVSKVIAVTDVITWKLSTSNPIDWANLDGSRMNGWNQPADYPDWLGVVDPSIYEGFSLQINSSTGAVVYTAPDGNVEQGSYTLDDKGFYTFTGINPSFPVVGWANFELTADKQLRILSIEKDGLGNLSGMWVGAKDPVKPEYVAYHLVPSVSGGAGSDPAAIVKGYLCSKTWKIDSDREYDVDAPWAEGRYQGPVIFSDYASWSWNPLPGEQYGAGEVGIDYGTMKFNEDGTVIIKQRVRRFTYEEELGGVTQTLVRSGLPQSGDVLETDEIVTLNGIWVFNLDTWSLKLSVDMLHPWTADYAVADWGNITVFRAEENVLIFQVMRSQELSGEDAMPMGYVFVPVE